ncbi:hypothetical protein [Sphingomonas sp. DC2300-3]|uniref:hypothetical protein n=1 Tax=unclassified Sphingomonas TaxID=196159 RepID=UPI003CF58616
MVIDTNVNGPFLMACAAVPAMLETGGGRIGNISMPARRCGDAASRPMAPPKRHLNRRPRSGRRTLRTAASP